VKRTASQRKVGDGDGVKHEVGRGAMPLRITIRERIVILFACRRKPSWGC
jgi:hypothetical protein